MPKNPSPEERLQRRLNYQFTNPALLSLALTHRSVGSTHNERLEFLGDGVLGAVVAEILYQSYPDLDEGALTRLRVTLVRGETLADIALEIDLGDFIKLGPGELKSGGFSRRSILANAVEALIGAVHLDGGADASRQFILELFKGRFDHLEDSRDVRDFKTQLQELVQRLGQSLPDYQVVKITGADHARSFTVECSVSGQEKPFTGSGRSRKLAEQQAASVALKALEVNHA